MEQLKRIIHVVDADMRAGIGLQRAAQLARRTGAELQLLMCAYDPMLDLSLEPTNARVLELARAQFLAQRRDWLHARTAELAAQGLRVQCEVLWAAQPHEAVMARVLALEPGLVIRDLLPRRKGARRMQMSSVDWRLARTCPAPLMFVRQDSPPLPRRIAAAVDVSLDRDDAGHPLNEDIAATALRLAMFADAGLRLAYVFPYQRPGATVGISVDLRALYRDVRQAASENFARFAARHSVPEDARHWIENAGDAATALKAFVAEQRVDLLVIGSSYHSALGRLLLGSVSEDLLRGGACDVLLVKPADFRGQLGRHYDFAALQRRFEAPDAAA